mgnify:CR=1 FL=1
MPANATALKQLFFDHDGLLIASPEYNSSLTPLLKNTIDWVSRKADDESPLQAFTGKAAALLAASPGQFGGLRGLVHVRSILGNIGVHVLPRQLVIPQAHQAFYSHPQLKDPKQQTAAESLGAELVRLVNRLASS